MNDVNYFKVSELPIVDAVPEGATVLAYNEGRLVRVDGKNVGGGGKVVTIKQDGYDDFVAGIAPAGAAAMPTFTCDTPYDEIVRMILAGEHFTGVLRAADPSMGIIADFATTFNYVPFADIPFVVWVPSPDMNGMRLFITADGVSVEPPAGV